MPHLSANVMNRYRIPLFMAIYSHSRLGAYEQCPYRFKLQYIDKIETDVEEGVEAFLGIRVHETLEKLYRDLMHEKKNTLEELLFHLDNEWEKNWNDDIVIVKKQFSKENYHDMARRFVTDYYNSYDPFDQTRTIALEERIHIDLDGNGEYQLQGYIDRLSESKDSRYEIHDYKTNSRLPMPESIRSDRQLALYALGVKEQYPNVDDIRLVWHFLAFDKEITSSRTDQELQEIKDSTIQLIDKIRSTEEFPTSPSGLCNWCEFRGVCKEWAHLEKLENKPANEYLNDPGVKLVNKYAELEKRKKQMTEELYGEINKIQEALLHFAEKEKIDVIYGSDSKVKIQQSSRYSFPSKGTTEMHNLVELLKNAGKWDEIEQLDIHALNNVLKEKTWEEPLMDQIKQYCEYKVKKSVLFRKKT